MAVLNTTSPTERPGAPMETPSKREPSSRARIAGWVTGFALDAEKAGPLRLRNPPAGCSRTRARWEPVRETGLRRARILAAPGQLRQRKPRFRQLGLKQQFDEPVAPRGTAGDPARRVQRPTRENIAVGGPVDQLDALAQPGELHGV